MKTSVALCTYNGSHYIIKQLESIAQQTVLPDEVIICDDGSKDDTVQVIQTYASNVSLPIKLHLNKINLGSLKNFEKALSLCTGDVIFLCDQDDLWLPQKVEKLMAYINQNPEIDVVFTDGFVIDDTKKKLDTLWNRVRFTKQEQELWKKGKAFEQMMQFQNRATGATMAIRKSFLPVIMPFPQMHLWIHDGIIALKAALLRKIAFLDEKLILYREHYQQQMGLKLEDEKPFQSFTGKIKNKKWINKDDFIFEKYEDIKMMNEWVTDAAHKKIVSEKMRHFEKRLAANTKNHLIRPFIIFPEWIKGNYKKFSSGTHVPPWILVVKDLFGT